MQCAEGVVDISFLSMSRWLAVTLAHSGTIIYDLSSLQVAMKCVTPPGERHPRLWTAFCSTVSPHTGACHSSYTVPTARDKYGFLSGDNGSVYMFELTTSGRGSALSYSDTASPGTASASASAGTSAACPLTGVVELPAHVTMAVAMTIVTPRHVASSLSLHVFLIVLGECLPPS